MVCRFLLEVGADFKQVITVNEYFAMASKVILGLGLVFEMPVLILFLARLGIVDHRFLLRHFRYAVLIIFVIAAVITPTPDIATQSVFAVPMIGALPHRRPRRLAVRQAAGAGGRDGELSGSLASGVDSGPVEA